MKTIFVLIWFVVVPEQSVQYYQLGTYDNDTLCKVGLRNALVMVNDKNETVECIRVLIDD
jgi:hypothetical protein